ncbi:MAG TPA: DUF2442 domain-containing protein [Planctomycetota bacterium]|nr:DUF2442 domain-containing protein [Planctomycetota bacterium]
MKSSRRGATISEAEVIGINRHGIWLYVKGAEYFLPHGDYPWFKEARIADILDVRLLHETHLHWPALDVDLCLESLGKPEAFPLVYR